MPTIRIPPDAYEGLGLLARLGRKLNALNDLLNDFKPHMPFHSYAGALSKALSVEHSEAHELIETILTLQLVKNNREDDPTSFYSLLSNTIDDNAPPTWKNLYWTKWKTNEDGITHVLDNEHISLILKAQKLAYEHQAILKDSFIVTDMRPVFSDKPLQIVGSVVNNIISIEFVENDNLKSIRFALDIRDLDKLANQCHRAIKKTREIEKHSEHNGRFVLIPGEKSDE